MADDEKLEAAEPAAEPDAPAESAAPTPAEPVKRPRARATKKTPAAAKAETASVAAEPVPAEAAEPVEEERSARAPRGVKPKRQDAGPKRPKTTKERGAYTRTPSGERSQGDRRERRGVVVSAKEHKTITIRVDVNVAHPKYQKIMRRSVKLRAHDETNQAKLGDIVRIVECRPLSKTKRWRLVEIVEVAK
jgi:small subunit ribosomal protein S17